MGNLASSFAKLHEQLQALRPVLMTGPDHSYLDVFDEFIEQREYGLALHALCDFILEPNSPWVSSSIVDQIRTLHALMPIDDDCVRKLQKTSVNSGASTLTVAGMPSPVKRNYRN